MYDLLHVLVNIRYLCVAKFVHILSIFQLFRWLDDLRFQYSSTAFQSYQDNDSVIIKQCTMEPCYWLERLPLPVGLEPGAGRSEGQCLTC